VNSNDNLEERISSNLETLSPKQIRLARFFLDNKYFMSFASANQAGEKTGTSAATVVRFAQTLGYEGFSELQEALRAELPSYLTAVEHIQERLEAPLAPDNISQQVFHTDIRNIERTANSLSEDRLNAAIDNILQAKQILVVGSGLSAAAVLFLAHSLKVIGFESRAITSEGLSLAAIVSQTGPEDLLIAIDLWRYVRSTVEAVSTAKHYGAA
jgi:DNA-binding MurR/RpiR family transcriptional regulator